MLELLLELVRPLGNVIVRAAMPKDWVDEDSLLSDAIGAISLILLVVVFIWLLLRLLGSS